MLATIGFITAGLCFWAFAYTFDSLVAHKAKLKLSQFSYAYYSLGLALFTWGMAAAVNKPDFLKHAVLVGDGYLLLGTVFMLDIWFGKKNRRPWLGLAVLLAAALLYVRAVHFPPAPYMHNGILIFNTQRVVAAVLGLIFAGIWLPVSLRVAKLVTHKIGQDSITQTYSGIYVAATASALFFLIVRRTATVILSFVALGICFALLVFSNVLVAKLTETKHGRRK